MKSVVAVALILWLTFSLLVHVGMMGREREPLESFDIFLILVQTALMIGAVVYLASA